MKRLLSAVALALAGAGCAGGTLAPAAAPIPAGSGIERPIAYPVEYSAEFERAIARGTRTASGAPGPRYWQNWADYRVRTRLRPADKRLEGSVQIACRNDSPDTLRTLHLDLNQNLHAPGAVRSEPAEVTGGVELRRVAARGQNLAEGGPQGEGPRYVVNGTRMVIVPPRPVLPGETVPIAVDWAFDVPQAGAGERMGYDGEDFFFLAYWYPQMAVYDDITGWHPDPFRGGAEFYSGFGSYDITVEVPTGWVVMGTGDLRNASEVLAAPVLERVRRAERSDSVISVLAAADLGRATRGRPGQTLRWHFVADSVRDVAFAAMRRSQWDAVRAPVGDRDGDSEMEFTRVDAFYREPAFRWRNSARYGRHSIAFLSRYTGYSYPWPHMTAVEGAGVMGGGMEYPMMTLIGDYTQAGDSALYNVTVHEIAHMWVPMMVGTDERRYSWMDEGVTTFNENQARAEFFPGSDPDVGDQRTYVGVALAGLEGEMMRRSDFHYPGPAFAVASYMKPATILVALRGILGEEVFNRALQEFIDRWAFKHPQPYDLWNTFEAVSGRDLDWFWRSWYFETWTLGQSISSVVHDPSGSVVTVRDIGNVPMPVRLTATRADGSSERAEIPVETWLAGARTASVRLGPGSPVARVEIDPERFFPDVNRDNNIWTGAAQ